MLALRAACYRECATWATWATCASAPSLLGVWRASQNSPCLRSGLARYDWFSDEGAAALRAALTLKAKIHAAKDWEGNL